MRASHTPSEGMSGGFHLFHKYSDTFPSLIRFTWASNSLFVRAVNEIRSCDKMRLALQCVTQFQLMDIGIKKVHLFDCRFEYYYLGEASRSTAGWLSFHCSFSSGVARSQSGDFTSRTKECNDDLSCHTHWQSSAIPAQVFAGREANETHIRASVSWATTMETFSALSKRFPMEGSGETCWRLPVASKQLVNLFGEFCTPHHHPANTICFNCYWRAFSLRTTERRECDQRDFANKIDIEINCERALADCNQINFNLCGELP